MALKDLIADKKKITEETIEDIVSKYVRYDPTREEIVLTPDGSTLSGEKKLLVYLVAVLGWEYIVEEVPQVPTRPVDLAATLGISGGTLRPMLKKLSDGRLLTKNDGGYTVQFANLDTIASIIKGTKTASATKSKVQTKKKAAATKNPPKKAKAGSGGTKTGSQLGPVLSGWIADGFFSNPRTLADVQRRFHEEAIIVKRTSLSGLLLRAVRNRQLKRKKAEVDGKSVWAYCV